MSEEVVICRTRYCNIAVPMGSVQSFSRLSALSSLLQTDEENRRICSLSRLFAAASGRGDSEVSGFLHELHEKEKSVKEKKEKEEQREDNEGREKSAGSFQALQDVLEISCGGDYEELSGGHSVEDSGGDSPEGSAYLAVDAVLQIYRVDDSAVLELPEFVLEKNSLQSAFSHMIRFGDSFQTDSALYIDACELWRAAESLSCTVTIQEVFSRINRYSAAEQD